MMMNCVEKFLFLVIVGHWSWKMGKERGKQGYNNNNPSKGGEGFKRRITLHPTLGTIEIRQWDEESETEKGYTTLSLKLESSD